MATEDAEESDDDALRALYRRYVGEPERERDVYLGFALFFGGIALGAIGLLIFLWSATFSPEAALYWQLREVAITLAALGLPGFVLSVVVLLPVGRRVVIAGSVGAAVCVLAIAFFVAVYPGSWNVPRGPDYSAGGIALYAGGLAALVAATGSALVAHHLQRAAPGAAPAEGDAGGAAGAVGASGSGTAGGEAVTDEQVEQDIEDALSDADLTWGGVERSDTKRISIRTDEAEADVEGAGFDPDAATTDRSEGVDDAVAGLRALQGGERETGTSEGVDDQAAALQELRERGLQEEVADDSVVDRMRERLGF